MSVSKEDFYRPLYRNPDSDDEDLDNFAEFRKRSSQEAVHGQDLGYTDNVDTSQTSSQAAEVPAPQPAVSIPLPTHLRNNYITSLDQCSEWLDASKKDLTKVRQKRLKNFVLFYWPADSSRLPRKIRRSAYTVVIQCGGEIAVKWDDGYRVTHIVVDGSGKGREHKDVLQDLKLESLPDNVQLVKSTWVDAVINNAWIKSEDRYRVSGHPTSSAGSSSIGEIAPKKRSAREAQLESTDVKGPKHQKVSSSMPKKQILGSRPSFAEMFDRFADVAKPIDPRSPKLEKQNLHNFGVMLAVQMRNAGLDFEGEDELDKLVGKERQRRATREFIDYSDHISDKLTADGKNIDRLHQPLEDNEDGEASEDEILPGEAKNFLCAKKSLEGASETGPNAALIEQLKLLASHYATKADDAFRAKGYREAISAIRKQKHEITTKQQALDLKRVGSSIAAKIEEFGKYGRINMVEQFAVDPREQTLRLFSGVYGVGPRTAEEWYSHGLRSIEDLKKIVLHKHQRVGLEHYEDFNSRIPRSEVTSHVEYVTNAARNISEHLQVVVGGSYRRGQADSGDVDFLITALDSHISTTQLQKLVFDQLIPSLRDTGYIRADLTVPSENKDSSKWLGAACLPDVNPQIWRRVDILFVPNAEWGAALLYFTGNDIFNRSMRLLARRGGGSLNQHGLYKGVVRNKRGVKIVPGRLVEGRDERKIFEALGVKWRPPHERCP